MTTPAEPCMPRLNPLSWVAARRERDEALVAGVLLRTPDLSGYPLSKKTGLRAGRLYAALARMERDGRIASRWADGPYPRRRLYRLTAIENPEEPS